MAKSDVINQGVYNNLMSQIKSIKAHCNQGSFGTRHRYEEATDRFCQYLADEFRLQKFVNVKEKHIGGYVEHLKENGKSPGTIKTDLSGIRFFYDQSGGKNKLPTNIELDLERRKFGGVYRAWSDEEYDKALLIANDMGNNRVEWALSLARTLGLRVHEIVRLDRSQLNASLKRGYLRVKGKGGKIRDIPLTNGAPEVIEEIVEGTLVGKKAFVEPYEKAHQAIKSIQNWIKDHREKFSDRKVSIHGLRHRYAQERYKEALEKYNGDERKAREEVSRLLGHERDEVTRIYLVDEKTANRAL